MDPDLYDEFGNYIGPDLESEEDSGSEDEARADRDQDDRMEVCYIEGSLYQLESVKWK